MPSNQVYSIVATSGASITVSTTAGICGGFLLYASAAAATITIKDGSTTILAWSGAAAAVLSWPAQPFTFSTNLTVTNSGAGTYSVLYAKKF